MKELIDLTSAELFDNLIAFSTEGGREIDLHGDYACSRIQLLKNTLMLQFTIIGKGSSQTADLWLVFTDAIIDRIEIDDGSNRDDWRLEILERVRSECAD